MTGQSLDDIPKHFINEAKIRNSFTRSNKMNFHKIYPQLLFLLLYQLSGSSQDSLINDIINNKIPQNLQLSHIEIKDQYIDFTHIKDPGYNQKIEFGKALGRSFDSVAAHYNYPLNLKLPYYLNDLSFHFSAIDWKAPHKIQYSYFLEGSDKNWSEPNQIGKAEYRKLPPGEYILKIKAIGEEQEWSKAFIYPFHILPPWWQTWWAYFSYMLVILGVLTGISFWWRERNREVLEMRHLLEAHKGMAFSNTNYRKPQPGSDSFLNLVHHTLESHLSDENFGIAELCEKLNISRTQLHRKLKKLSGLSTSHYIRSMRLDIAKNLLETTDLNVSEVAFSVGFSSATYFSKAFKEEFGSSPSELR